MFTFTFHNKYELYPEICEICILGCIENLLGLYSFLKPVLRKRKIKKIWVYQQNAATMSWLNYPLITLMRKTIF
jgi:hypothetical protein